MMRMKIWTKRLTLKLRRTPRTTSSSSTRTKSFPASKFQPVRPIRLTEPLKRTRLQLLPAVATRLQAQTSAFPGKNIFPKAQVANDIVAQFLMPPYKSHVTRFDPSLRFVPRGLAKCKSSNTASNRFSGKNGQALEFH